LTYELKYVAFEESCREGTVVESNYTAVPYLHTSMADCQQRGGGPRYKQYKVSASLVDTIDIREKSTAVMLYISQVINERTSSFE
jgi:hypothetical protein